eukprot:461375-Pyramimonas_sp.AAC.2
MPERGNEAMPLERCARRRPHRGSRLKMLSTRVGPLSGPGNCSQPLCSSTSATPPASSPPAPRL